eukprot:5781277-Pleurochrysis_carterae.AAC.2
MQTVLIYAYAPLSYVTWPVCHCEYLSNSGYCGCSREALRTVHKAPANETELKACLDSISCVSLMSWEQGCCLGHGGVPDEHFHGAVYELAWRLIAISCTAP